MKHSPLSIGEAVRSARKHLDLTQKDLALTSGTGLRFIIDLEKGKPTCQIGKVLRVLHTLGIQINLILPPIENSEGRSARGARNSGSKGTATAKASHG